MHIYIDGYMFVHVNGMKEALFKHLWNLIRLHDFTLTYCQLDYKGVKVINDHDSMWWLIFF